MPNVRDDRTDSLIELDYTIRCLTACETFFDTLSISNVPSFTRVLRSGTKDMRLSSVMLALPGNRVFRVMSTRQAGNFGAPPPPPVEISIASRLKKSDVPVSLLMSDGLSDPIQLFWASLCFGGFEPCKWLPTDSIELVVITVKSWYCFPTTLTLDDRRRLGISGRGLFS